MNDRCIVGRQDLQGQGGTVEAPPTYPVVARVVHGHHQRVSSVVVQVGEVRHVRQGHVGLLHGRTKRPLPLCSLCSRCSPGRRPHLVDKGRGTRIHRWSPGQCPQHQSAVRHPHRHDDTAVAVVAFRGVDVSDGNAWWVVGGGWRRRRGYARRGGKLGQTTAPGIIITHASSSSFFLLPPPSSSSFLFPLSPYLQWTPGYPPTCQPCPPTR
jgi:hypothetical protein